MRNMALITLVLVTLAAFFCFGKGAEAAEPDTIKVTVATDAIYAAEDGTYRVALEANTSTRGVSTTPPGPTYDDQILKEGDQIVFSREFSLKVPEFIWKLTVTPPSHDGDETRPLILIGEISPSNIDELVSPSAQSGTNVSASPYLQSQPPSHGLNIGDTPVMIKLSVFSARMNACSRLQEGFSEGDYTVNLWMDGNNNQQREPNEEAEAVSQPDLDGTICMPLELRSFSEAVTFVYEFTDPQGQILGPATGDYNYATGRIGGDFPEAPVRWMGVGFHGSVIELEVKLTNPFTAYLTEANRIETLKEPTDLCKARPPDICPSIGVPPPLVPDAIPSTSFWEQWPEKFKDNKAYIPVLGLTVGVIGVALQLGRRRGA